MHNRHYEDDFEGDVSETHGSDEENFVDESSTETVSDSEHDSSTEMSVLDESSIDFLNDDEFASYRKIFDSFMMKVYKDTYDEVMATEEDKVAFLLWRQMTARQKTKSIFLMKKF